MDHMNTVRRVNAHHVICPHFAASALFHQAVHLHLTLQNHLLGCTAAGSQRGGFEQGIQCDVVGA